MKDLSEQDLRTNIPLVSKKVEGGKSEVKVGPHAIGGNRLVVIAGPCAVENEEQIFEIAKEVKSAGASLLRGGAYKPLTFPYRNERTFELGEEGLRYLHQAGQKAGLPVVTEVLDVRLVERVAQSTDMIQIGARNMQNFPLLVEVAKTHKPVLLKRHPGASLRDWFGAAEYLLYHGNPNVVLCERGIVTPHTHEPTSRFLVDLEAIPAVREYSHLPVIVDPSHATFKRSYVGPVAKAALAVGADGIMVDVHPTPDKAAVDPLQALNYPDFRELMQQLRRIAEGIGKTL